MLRRVARASRIGLLIAGALLVIWLPLSFFVAVSLRSSVFPSEGMTNLGTLDGRLGLLFWHDAPGYRPFEANVGPRDANARFMRREAFLPSVGHNPVQPVTYFIMPLWLLA